jgi:hypothetical protein
MKATGFALMCLLLIAEESLAQESKASPQPGRYQVVNTKAAVIEMAILVDTSTGKTWRLGAPAGSAETAWTPISRLDTPEQIKEWAKTHPPISKNR